MAETIAQSKPLLAVKGIRIQARVPAGLTTWADSTRLQQVLWNLVSNAIKFTAANSRVTISAGRSGSRASIQVRDQGPGIPVADHDRIFEDFVQLDARIDGIGLGLALSRRLVDAMGGTLTVRSRPGEGAAFVVSLPLG